MCVCVSSLCGNDRCKQCTIQKVAQFTLTDGSVKRKERETSKGEGKMAEVLQLQRGRGGKSISMQNSSEPLDACGAIDDHMKSREREAEKK